jgi:hypothetical protein
MQSEKIVNDFRSSILKPMRTDYMSVWDLLELVCKSVELEMKVTDEGVLIRRPKPEVCQECFDKIVIFKGSGRDSYYYICGQVDTPGHISRNEVIKMLLTGEYQ